MLRDGLLKQVRKETFLGIDPSLSDHIISAEYEEHVGRFLSALEEKTRPYQESLSQRSMNRIGRSTSAWGDCACRAGAGDRRLVCRECGTAGSVNIVPNRHDKAGAVAPSTKHWKT
jgi:hypothetical protein